MATSDTLALQCRDNPTVTGQKILGIALAQKVAMRMVDQIKARMKLEPGITYVRPPSRLVGIGGPSHLTFSEMPVAPEEDEGPSVMAHEVGVTEDATIAAAAAAGGDEPLYGDESVLSAKAGAAEPSLAHEKDVDYGGGSVHSSRPCWQT